MGNVATAPLNGRVARSVRDFSDWDKSYDARVIAGCDNGASPTIHERIRQDRDTGVVQIVAIAPEHVIKDDTTYTQYHVFVGTDKITFLADPSELDDFFMTFDTRGRRCDGVEQDDTRRYTEVSSLCVQADAWTDRDGRRTTCDNLYLCIVRNGLHDIGANIRRFFEAFGACKLYHDTDDPHEITWCDVVRCKIESSGDMRKHDRLWNFERATTENGDERVRYSYSSADESGRNPRFRSVSRVNVDHMFETAPSHSLVKCCCYSFASRECVERINAMTKKRPLFNPRDPLVFDQDRDVRYNWIRQTFTAETAPSACTDQTYGECVLLSTPDEFLETIRDWPNSRMNVFARHGR